jgi:hypothetical protein
LPHKPIRRLESEPAATAPPRREITPFSSRSGRIREHLRTQVLNFPDRPELAEVIQLRLIYLAARVLRHANGLLGDQLASSVLFAEVFRQLVGIGQPLSPSVRIPLRKLDLAGAAT